MDNVTIGSDPEPPLPAPLLVAVGMCLLAVLGVTALVLLWGLSHLPLVGGFFAAVLDAFLAILNGLRVVVVWLFVFAVKSAITLMVVTIVVRAVRPNGVRIGLVVSFLAWFWTGLFDSRPTQGRSPAFDSARLWNDWHSEYFRQ
jgi:hypothetical protein